MLKTDYARSLASLGFAVFPCRPGGKPPLVAGGFRAATRDDATIQSWWGWWPSANIGLYPEACRPRLLVLDFDCKGGARGLETARNLLAEGVLDPRDMTVRTPSGGLHVYLRIGDGRRYGNGHIPGWAGVDVRQAHGYVLTVGSEIGGRRYAPGGYLADALEHRETADAA